MGVEALLFPITMASALATESWISRSTGLGQRGDSSFIPDGERWLIRSTELDTGCACDDFFLSFSLFLSVPRSHSSLTLLVLCVCGRVEASALLYRRAKEQDFAIKPNHS